MTTAKQYDFPLRKDWVVTVRNVPINLTVKEADRMARMLHALVMPKPKRKGKR